MSIVVGGILRQVLNNLGLLARVVATQHILAAGAPWEVLIN